MPLSQTSCCDPGRGQESVGRNDDRQFNAFGPEANFSYPPKPAGNAGVEYRLDCQGVLGRTPCCSSAPIWAAWARWAAAALAPPPNRPRKEVQRAARHPAARRRLLISAGAFRLGSRVSVYGVEVGHLEPQEPWSCPLITAIAAAAVAAVPLPPPRAKGRVEAQLLRRCSKAASPARRAIASRSRPSRAAVSSTRPPSSIASGTPQVNRPKCRQPRRG